MFTFVRVSKNLFAGTGTGHIHYPDSNPFLYFKTKKSEDTTNFSLKVTETKTSTWIQIFLLFVSGLIPVPRNVTLS